jgi:hypothetical protein
VFAGLTGLRPGELTAASTIEVVSISRSGRAR